MPLNKGSPTLPTLPGTYLDRHKGNAVPYGSPDILVYHPGQYARPKIRSRTILCGPPDPRPSSLLDIFHRGALSELSIGTSLTSLSNIPQRTLPEYMAPNQDSFRYLGFPISSRGAAWSNEPRNTSRTCASTNHEHDALLDRPTVFREIDGIAVGIVHPVFRLAVRRALIDDRCGVELVASGAHSIHVFDLKTEVIDARF